MHSNMLGSPPLYYDMMLDAASLDAVIPHASANHMVLYYCCHLLLSCPQDSLCCCCEVTRIQAPTDLGFRLFLELLVPGTE